MENGVNWQRWWHVQLELRRLGTVAGHNTVPGPFSCTGKITLSMNHFRVLFSHNSSSLLCFNDWASRRLTEQRLKGKNKGVYLHNFVEFTWKGWGRHSDGENQSCSRELTDLHSSGESSSTHQREQCTQVYTGWLRGTIWVNKTVQTQTRLTAVPWALSCICLSQNIWHRKKTGFQIARPRVNTTDEDPTLWGYGWLTPASLEVTLQGLLKK